MESLPINAKAEGRHGQRPQAKLQIGNRGELESLTG
jgi:hypothetical protein